MWLFVLQYYDDENMLLDSSDLFLFANKIDATAQSTSVDSTCSNLPIGEQHFSFTFEKEISSKTGTRMLFRLHNKTPCDYDFNTYSRPLQLQRNSRVGYEIVRDQRPSYFLPDWDSYLVFKILSPKDRQLSPDKLRPHFSFWATLAAGKSTLVSVRKADIKKSDALEIVIPYCWGDIDLQAIKLMVLPVRWK